ncbi:MAG: glycosyltransferase [Hyphomicrobiales bacterium]
MIRTAKPDILLTNDSSADLLSVIIAAHNEEAYIGSCLESLLMQDQTAGRVIVIVAANACTDQTEKAVHDKKENFARRGWQLKLLSIEAPGKLNAFNHADRAAVGTMRVYLDADVICNPELLGQLRGALNKSKPIYATGTLEVAPAKSWVTRAYANLWVQLPFMKGGCVGAGLFAVNALGRERWGPFPSIISDDTFVRMNFAPDERIEVPARYQWPMVEGFRNLVQVRRRQDTGVSEVERLYPDLIKNDTKTALSKGELFKIFLKTPISFTVYAIVHLFVRLREGGAEWTRGR